MKKFIIGLASDFHPADPDDYNRARDWLAARPRGTTIYFEVTARWNEPGIYDSSIEVAKKALWYFGGPMRPDMVNMHFDHMKKGLSSMVGTSDTRMSVKTYCLVLTFMDDAEATLFKLAWTGRKFRKGVTLTGK